MGKGEEKEKPVKCEVCAGKGTIQVRDEKWSKSTGNPTYVPCPKCSDYAKDKEKETHFCTYTPMKAVNGDVWIYWCKECNNVVKLPLPPAGCCHCGDDADHSYMDNHHGIDANCSCFYADNRFCGMHPELYNLEKEGDGD